MTRVVIGRTKSGQLVAWPFADDPGVVGARVVIGRTPENTLVAWPFAGDPSTAGTRVLLGRTPRSQYVAWPMTTVSGGCPDLAGRNPTDLSVDETFDMVAGGGVHDFEVAPSSTFYEIPVGRAVCVQDLTMRMEWLTVKTAGRTADLLWSIGGFTHGLGLRLDLPVSSDSDYVTSVLAGSFKQYVIPGQVIIADPEATISAEARGGGPVGNASGLIRATLRYTATEFDL